MAVKATVTPATYISSAGSYRDRLLRRLSDFPWWLAAMALLGVAVVVTISSQESYNSAFVFIRTGLGITITTTLAAFALALVMGLITGLMRISQNVILKNLGTLYVEMIRGVPMLVLIFFIALVLVPSIVEGVNALGAVALSFGMTSIGNVLTSIEPNGVSMNFRAVAALSITYGAFLAEVFRAGIQSIGRGQMEASRAQGMSYSQSMRYIILPQAIRNVLPALGNDFVSMLKDSSLVSVLAVRDITQVARLYAGRSFQFRESYLILVVLYLTMTMILSFGVKGIEKRFNQNDRC